jgi:hypothetical protein
LGRDGLAEAELPSGDGMRSSDTSAGTTAMILGFGPPASAAALEMVGPMNSTVSPLRLA